jgi:hypothetical protein
VTIFLRALYGPFGRQTNEHVARYGGHIIPATQVDWHFFGIREDNSMGRWAVRFTVKVRTWQIVNYSLPDKPAVSEFADAFVPDKPMVFGRTYLEILKPRLSKEDIAFASRLALEALR